jgi:hypothetical protein
MNGTKMSLQVSGLEPLSNIHISRKEIDILKEREVYESTSG